MYQVYGYEVLVHEPDNIRVSSGWAKECCYFLFLYMSTLFIDMITLVEE